MSRIDLPYGRHLVDEDDIAAVVAVLRGDWLTTGPAVETFESAFASFVGAEHGVSCSNGTAALHLALAAADVGPGDEVIVPSLTFVASANAALYVGADVRFADVRPDTLTIDPAHVASLVTSRTRAVVAVDYAGIPCDLDELRTIADRHGLLLVEDACHAPGARYRDRCVGSIADLTAFSFHPVKHLTTAEGGMVTTDDARLAGRLRLLRNHGIDADARQRERTGIHTYDAVALGFNYRLPDVNAALGASQLAKLPRWLEHRRALTRLYEQLLGSRSDLRLLEVPEDRSPAWHLFPVRLVGDQPRARRNALIAALRRDGIGANVHYPPVHLHSLYRARGHGPGECPVVEDAAWRLLSLPLWAGLDTADVRRVVSRLDHHLGAEVLA